MFLTTKKFILALVPVFIFSLLAHDAMAQTKTKKVTVQQGEEVDTKRSSIREIAGYDETGYYTVRAEKTHLFIEHLNKQMNVDKSTQISEGDEEYYNYSALMEGNFYLFSIETDKKALTTTLFYQKVDKKTLVAEVDPHPLIVTKMASKRDVYGHFTHNISPDESKLLYYSKDSDKDENGDMRDDSRFHLTVFDSKMAKVWTKDIKIPIPPAQFTVQQVKVDNSGTVYIIGIEYEEKSDARVSRREGNPTYKYRIYRYSNNGTEMVSMPIELKDKFITDVQIDGAPNGDLVAAGFYSDKGTYSVKGAFYIRLDGKTQQVVVSNFKPFESDFITEYFTEKEKKKSEKKEAKGQEQELFSFEMDELLIRTDGGATLIAEQYRTYTVCTTSTNANGGTTTTCRTYYVYNDIMVITFNADGSIAWKCKIPKRQTTQEDGGYYSSYTYAAVDDKLYFIYNDNPKNLYLTSGEKIYNYIPSKEAAVILAEVDANGKVTRELLLTTEKGELNIRPKMCTQTGAKEMIILAQESKTYQFSKVTFK
ncbi:MAG: hypothetical protein ABIQ40_04905 [Bacteroidia bacterium]